MQANEFQLILKAYTFKISSDCLFLSTINSDICTKLKSKQKYKVKSNINKETFQCFLDYLTKSQIPDINNDNYDEYLQLSEEFDIMKPLIQIYSKYRPSNSKSTIISLINENKTIIRQKSTFLNDKKTEYQQIINLLFSSKEFYSFIKKPKSENKLYEYCDDYDVDKVSLLTSKMIIQGSFSFLLNDKDKTAEIHCEYKSNPNVLFPRAIHYKSQEYIVKSISKEAINYKTKIKTIKFQKKSEISVFQISSFLYARFDCIVIPPSITKIKSCSFYNCYIKKMTFTKDSKLKTIEKGAFMHSKIANISIPSSIENLSTDALHFHKHIYILKCKKQNIKLSEDNDFILAKSNSSNTIFDVILFAFPKVTNPLIPSNIKTINESSFIKCDHLQNIRFDSNSSLKTIDSYAFFKTQLKYITIPSSVKKIGSFCFRECNQLKTIEFLKDSKLKTIENSAFYSSSLENIILPSSIKNLKEFWCDDSNKLTHIKIIHCKYENIMLYENKFIIGKSNLLSDNYDILLFACRDVKNVTIPSFIEKIDSMAFQKCKKLKNIYFSKNSKLKYIGKSAFEDSSIENISIPTHVTKIGQYAFQNCINLKKFEFENNCELTSISPYLFYNSSLKRIKIPRNVGKICRSSFCGSKLEIIDFIQNSELTMIRESAFGFSKIRCISIPSQVIKISDSLNEAYSMEIIELNENLLNLNFLSRLLSLFNKNLIIMIPHSAYEIVSKHQK